jgi:hypothetical protein
MQIDYNTYKTEDFTCTKCKWKGKGEELVNGDFSEVSFICNLDCPDCGQLIAFWQAPVVNNPNNTDISKTE